MAIGGSSPLGGQPLGGKQTQPEHGADGDGQFQAHRHTDARFCLATTVVTHQSTVFVNNLLVAVEQDENTHGGGGLISTSPGTVFAENKKIIVVVNDTADPDNALHFPSVVDPEAGSPDVFLY